MAVSGRPSKAAGDRAPVGSDERPAAPPDLPGAVTRGSLNEMDPDMDPNTRLGERLIAHGVDRAQVARAFEEARDPTRGDLADVLVASGHIPASLAEQVRAEVAPIPVESGARSSLPAPAAADSDTAIPGLRLGPVLAAGGMGRIHLATDLETGAEVVVKRLLTARSPGSARSPVPVTPASPEAIERFEREARALADVRHPHIVPVHRFGHSADGPWIVMARIEGRSLDELLEADPGLPRSEAGVRRIKRWFAQLAEALQALHRAGLVHRDLKPDNLLITDAGDDLMLVDLGLARRLESHSEGRLESLTKTGLMVGTPGYMAPEQLTKGSRFGPISPATDVWGFAASLYFALTGEAPISGGTVAEMSIALTSGRIAPPSAIAGKVDPVLESLCVAALTTDQRARPELATIRRALAEDQPLRTSSRGRRRIGYALAGLGVLALLLLLLRDTTAPRLHLEDSGPVLTRLRRYEMRGRIEDANPAFVLIGDREVRVDSRGRFRGVVELDVGAQTLTCVAVDESGQRSEPARVVVTCDREPPTLRFGPPGRPETGRFELEITASEPGCTLRIGERPWRFRGDRLVLQLGARELEAAGCEVEDAAGNRAPVRLPLRLIQSDSRGLAAILTEARPGDWLILPPGRRRVTIAGRLDASIMALEPGKTVLTAADDRPVIHLDGGSLRLDGIVLERADGRRREAAASGSPVSSAMTSESLNRPVIVVSAGDLVLTGCRITSSGAGCRVDGRVDGRAGAAIVTLEDSRFQTYGPALDARRCVATVRRTHFDNLGALPIEQALVRFESCPRAELIACDIMGARNHGLEFVDTRAIVELCRIQRSVSRGLNIDTSLIDLLGCDVLDSGEDGLRADGHSRLRVAASVFRGNGAMGKVSREGLFLFSGSNLDGRSLAFDGGGALRVEQGGVIRLGRVRGLGADRLFVRPGARIDCGDHDYRRVWRDEELLTPSQARARAPSEWLIDLREPGDVGRRASSALRLRVEELGDDLINELARLAIEERSRRAREVLAARSVLPSALLARVARTIAAGRWYLTDESRALFTRSPLPVEVVDALAAGIASASKEWLVQYLGLLDGCVATPALDAALAARMGLESRLSNLVALILVPRTSAGRAAQLEALPTDLARQAEAGRILMLRAAFEALQSDAAARERLVQILRAEASPEVRAGVLAWLPTRAYPIAERLSWLEPEEAQQLAATGELWLARTLAESQTAALPEAAGPVARRRLTLSLTRRPLAAEEVAALRAAARDASPLMRSAAAMALPWSGPGAGETLEELIGDDVRRVAELAELGHRRLKDPALARPTTVGTTLLDSPR